jgi:hypothetical protein
LHSNFSPPKSLHQEIPAPDPAPLLRVPDWPLPTTRFVPGLHPHPFRHPDGHMFVDGQAPQAPVWSGDVHWQEDRLWLRGLDLFDQRFFWECHELFEGIWHQAVPGSEIHALCQGLIQASAFVLKIHMGHKKAAAALFMAAQSKLEGVPNQEEEVIRGVRIAHFIRCLSEFERGGDWPQIGR